MTASREQIEILPHEAGQRLDRVLAQRLDIPRNQIQQWIRAGRVQSAGHPVKASVSVAAGEVFEFSPPRRDLDAGIAPESGALTILYEDRDLIVLDKPAALAVHPGAGRTRGTLVHRLLSHYPEIGEVGGPGRPGIVHRLDKDTTGVLAIARTPRAYLALSRAFSERQVGKTYLAIAYGLPQRAAGRIDRPIGRHPVRRKEMAVRAGGRPAVTSYRTLASAAGISLLELDLETGRTHQIRVHLKTLGHPLVGDPLYGEARWKGLARRVRSILRDFPRPALHAWRLALAHPTTGQALTFEAPLPADMRLLWEEVTASDLPTLD